MISWGQREGKEVGGRKKERRGQGEDPYKRIFWKIPKKKALPD
jgi:hypothetical protein